MRNELFLSTWITASRIPSDRNAAQQRDVELALQDARRARRGHQHRRA